MKRAALLLALVFTVSSALANFSDLPNEVRANLTAVQKYPKAASILLWCSEYFTLDADNSQSYEWHSFRYFPDEAARDTWGDPRINYADGRQTVEILRARTYTNDGRQIDCTPENAYNPVVPDGMDLAPYFSEYRQMVVTLLGLENGSISEFHYRVTTPRPLTPWLEGRVYFREEVPQMTRELTVQVPVGITLTYQSDRGTPEPTVTGNKYLWKIGEQQGYLAEDLAGHRILLPNVSFSTAKGWEEICAILTSRIEAAGLEIPTTPESLEEDLAGINTTEARLEAIKTWVRVRFNKLYFDHSEFMLSLRPANQVLYAGYGNGLELAVMVKSLATAWGIRCDVMPRFLPKPSVPSLHEWADPALAVHSDLSATFLTDPIAPRSETWRELAASTTYDSSDCKVREAPAHSSATPHFNLWLTFSNLDRDTVSGHGSLIATGNWGCVELVREEGGTEFLNSLITLPGFDCTSSQLQELTDRGRVFVDFEFTIASLDTADGFHVLSPAALDFSKMVKGAPLALPHREFAQEIPMIGEVNLHLEAAIPQQWQITRRPENSSGMWDWTEGEVKCDVKDGRVVYERRLKLAREWLAPSGWSGFRTWMIESGPRPNNIIVFAPISEVKSKK